MQQNGETSAKVVSRMNMHDEYAFCVTSKNIYHLLNR